MEQLSTHYDQGHGLDWLEQALKDLPEKFRLVLCSRVWVCPLFWAYEQYLCAERLHIFDVEVEGSC